MTDLIPVELQCMGIVAKRRCSSVSGIIDRSRSVMRVLCTFSRNIPTCCNQLDSNLENLEVTVEVGLWDKFWSYVFRQLSGSTCPLSIFSSTRQCRDIIQMRWKTFTSFCSKFIQETVYHISSE